MHRREALISRPKHMLEHRVQRRSAARGPGVEPHFLDVSRQPGQRARVIHQEGRQRFLRRIDISPTVRSAGCDYQDIDARLIVIVDQLLHDLPSST